MKPTTKKERNAAKALARSKRNSPPGMNKTKRQVREERQVALERRRFRQAIPKVKQGAKGMGEAMSNLDTAATQATRSMKKLTKATEKIKEEIEARRSYLMELKKPQLNAIAKELRIRRFTMHRKSELVEMILEAEERRT